MLDALCATMGWHCKHAVRAFRRRTTVGPGELEKPQERKRRYPSADGMMHDECMVGMGGTTLHWSKAFRAAPDTAQLHESAYERLAMKSVSISSTAALRASSLVEKIVFVWRSAMMRILRAEHRANADAYCDVRLEERSAAGREAISSRGVVWRSTARTLVIGALQCDL
jgi:hypothetical protein